MWGKRWGFQPAILLGFVWFLIFFYYFFVLFSRECNGISPKIQWIFSSSFVRGPISSKVIGSSGNLRGYMVFNSYFTLHFLFCMKFVMMYFFFLILNRFFAVLSIYEISVLDLCSFFARTVINQFFAF